MARLSRQIFPGAWHHVIQRGAGRRSIFRTAGDARSFLDVLKRAGERYEVEVHAFCLMTNHYHLLVKDPLAKLSSAMRLINQTHAQRVNVHRETDGPVFRGRFTSTLVTTNRQRLITARYIHLNPFCDPATYRWSSHALYLSDRHHPWLRRAEILELAGGPECFDQFVRNPLPEFETFRHLDPS